MIEYNNKGISIARGDTGAILIELFNKDGTPFSLPVGMVHPYIVFSMASLLSRMQLSDELYIEKYYAVADYKLYGAVDGAGITGGFDRNVVTTWPAGDTLLPGKIYKNSTDNKYYFLDNSVSPSTVREYHFIVSLSFDGEDTRNIMPGIYKYSVNVIDSAFDIDMVNNEPDFAAFFAGMTQKDDIFGSQQFMVTDSQFVRGASTHIVQVLEMNPLSSAAQVAYRTLEIISRDSNGQLVLPIATATKLGAIRVGETLTISAFGILNVSNEIVALPDRVTLLEQGAVDLDRRLDYLEPVVEQLGVDMTAAQTDIADIQERMVNPETNIGSLTGEQFPADVTLDAFVLATAGRPVRNNDTIYFTLVTPAEDEYYKYVHSLTGWTRGKMPSQEPAKNGTKGIVQGTYAIDRTYNILVSIIDGEVRAIYFKNTTTNTYQQVDITLNTLLTRIDGIITGATMVGKAARANADGDGNIFSQVYAKIVNYYSKAESDDRYVSQSYITPYYYNINGTITDAPSLDRSAKYTVTVTAGNYAELATFERIIIGDLAFSAKDKYSASVWLSTSADIANLQVRLTTYLKHPDDTSYTLANTEVTGGLAFASGVLTKVQFSDNYRELASIFDSEPGDTFKQVISLFYTRSSGEAEGTRVVQMYSDRVYPSVFQFDIFYSPSKSPEVPSFTKVFSVTDWSALQADGCYHITIPEHQHGQGANKSPLVDLKTLDANGNYVALPSLYDISNDGTIDIFTDELFAGFVVIRSGTSAFVNYPLIEIGDVFGLSERLTEIETGDIAVTAVRALSEPVTLGIKTNLAQINVEPYVGLDTVLTNARLNRGPIIGDALTAILIGGDNFPLLKGRKWLASGVITAADGTNCLLTLSQVTELTGFVKRKTITNASTNIASSGTAPTITITVTDPNVTVNTEVRLATKDAATYTYMSGALVNNIITEADGSFSFEVNAALPATYSMYYTITEVR